MLLPLLLLLACADKREGEAGDRDGDGFTFDEDCNDQDAEIHPGATERCNEVDDDCDGVVDEDGITVFYVDTDGDGWGTDTEEALGCDPPSGFVVDPGDCDDADPTVHPEADEWCDGVDQDCDIIIDEDPVDGVWSWPDEDGDGYGAEEAGLLACTVPEGWLLMGGDCDDGDPLTFPGAKETCDDEDDDCDDVVDNEAVDAPIWQVDADGDGYGSETDTLRACEATGGLTTDASDCDDGDPAVNPSATEICGDGIDNDCDGRGCGVEGELSTSEADLAITADAISNWFGQTGDVGDLDGDGVDDVAIGAPLG